MQEWTGSTCSQRGGDRDSRLPISRRRWPPVSLLVSLPRKEVSFHVKQGTSTCWSAEAWGRPAPGARTPKFDCRTGRSRSRADVPCSVSRETLPPAWRADPCLVSVQAKYREQFRGTVGDPDRPGRWDGGRRGRTSPGRQQAADGQAAAGRRANRRSGSIECNHCCHAR